MKMGGGGGGMNRVRGGGGGMRAAVVAAACAWVAAAGGGGGGGGRGGGRRSDISVKHDIAFLGRLDNGLGFYRFSYNGSDKAYVGVMAQEVHSCGRMRSAATKRASCAWTTAGWGSLPDLRSMARVGRTRPVRVQAH